MACADSSAPSGQAFTCPMPPLQVAALAPLSALSAVVLIALICGSVMAQNAAAVMQAGPQLLAAVFVLHAGEPERRDADPI